ncbi:MAG: TetR/AcrR family transcriptional regulator [Roseobacter sp.]
MGLRERQKEHRQSQIVSAAKELFIKQGFERTTIESIAEAAGVSGVTVHNYYGTKAGVLLALVVESDDKLLSLLENKLDEKSGDLVSLTRKFARIVMDHALANLDKAIWRQVIAGVTLDAGSRFSIAYFRLDMKLAAVLTRQIETMQHNGHVPEHVNAGDLGAALFQLQNARFIEWVSVDALTCEQIDARLSADLNALFFLNTTTPPPLKPANLGTQP